MLKRFIAEFSNNAPTKGYACSAVCAISCRAKNRCGMPADVYIPNPVKLPPILPAHNLSGYAFDKKGQKLCDMAR